MNGVVSPRSLSRSMSSSTSSQLGRGTGSGPPEVTVRSPDVYVTVEQPRRGQARTACTFHPVVSARFAHSACPSRSRRAQCTAGGEMSKKRGVLVWCLFGLATILLFVSSLTVWSKRQLLDDQAWADSSTQLLANDEVRGAIAQKLSDALFARVDVEAQLRERLPPQRKGAAERWRRRSRTRSDPRPQTGSCSGRGCRPFGRTSTSVPTPVSSGCWRARTWARTETSRPRTVRSRLT